MTGRRAAKAARGHWKDWARRLKRDAVVLWVCARHPRTPFVVKMLAAALVAYALSPIDLIPDFIPVLGYLDDVIILPLGVWLTLKLVPGDVVAECRAEAERRIEDWRAAPRSRLAAAVIVCLWVAGFALLAWLGWRWVAPAG